MNTMRPIHSRSEEHTSELQSRNHSNSVFRTRLTYYLVNTVNCALTENYDGTLTVNQNALHFYNMQTLEGSGSDSLKGLSQKNVWHWSPEGGSVALDEPDAPDSFAIDFSGMNRLIGGGVADRLNSETDNGKWVMTEPHKGTLTVSGDEL